MSDKIIVKYTRNGVVEENLATKETKQLTTSEWGSQIRYEKQEQFRYNGRSEIEFKNDNSNDILTYRNSKNNNENEGVNSASESYYSPNEDEEYNDNNEFVYQNSSKRDKEYFDKTDTKQNEYLTYTQKSNIYSYLNDNVYENNIESTHSSHQPCSNNKKFGKSIFKNRNNKNISNSKSKSKKAHDEPFSSSNNISVDNRSVENSEILKGINTTPPKPYQTSYSSDISSQILQKKGGIKTRIIKETSKVLKGNDEEQKSEMTNSWLFKIIIAIVPIFGIVVLLPLFLVFIFAGIESTATQIQKSHSVISSYISQLDNELRKEIDDKVAEDKKQPNTEVIVENKEVIGTMTKQISAIAMSKFNFIDKLTDDYKSTIRSIHNLTYEYRVVINNDNGNIKKTYRVMALSLDELTYQMGLDDEEKDIVNQVLQILNKFVKPPEGGGDIPPSNPDGFANPLKVGTYTVTQWYGENGHQGIDLGAGEGTPIYASADGIVRFAGFGDASNGFNRYGYCVFIDHQNGFYTMYAHASALYVTVGQTVKQGQHIAGVGNTGQSFGNHLHFEVRGGLQYPRYNPSDYINF